MALDEKQALLSGIHQAMLYAGGMTLGKRIAAARKRAKITQTVLAQSIGTSYQAVSQWERGETDPEIEKIPAIAKRLDVSIAYLLTGEDIEPWLRNVLAQRLLRGLGVEE